MVERTESQGFEEFVGFARKVQLVDGNFGKQIEILLEPEDKSVLKKSKTGFFHEWIRFTASTTETSVPEGSVLDIYLREVESVFKEAKRCESVMDALGTLLDKKVLYKKKKLGKRFEGKEAADHWVPSRAM